ncbi:hypothetical protein [Aeromonas veronii]|uniref:hypothetical protein n=1 Tax=Aeromonas veronii TaxID=654 RepID=UPI001F309990|nr:hypothetical protein [Aeromonas veronii]MCF5874915.1 hypothetical protein [Aeromonas veronii]
MGSFIQKAEVSTAIDGDKANKWVMEFTVWLINLGMMAVMGVVVCLYSKFLLASRVLFNSD